MSIVVFMRTYCLQYGSPSSSIAALVPRHAKGGIITFIGLGEGKGATCSFDANRFHFKKLQLRAFFASPTMFTPLALTYLKEGVVDGEARISHRFPLTDIANAVRVATEDKDAVKVVVMQWSETTRPRAAISGRMSSPSI